MSGSLAGNYEFKFIKMRHTVCFSYIHYSIRNVSKKTNENISRAWRRGIIRTDKKCMFSSSFKKWVSIEIDEKGRYVFSYYNPAQGKFENYIVLDELLAFVDDVVAEQYLFGVS
jgi:hypothetical protein